jgi:hypothetical protein
MLLNRTDLSSAFSRLHADEASPSASLTELAPRPARVEDTGIPRLWLADLLSKHLAVAGVLDAVALARRLGLPGPVVDELLGFLRAEARVELRARRDDSPVLRYGLTERGRELAADALQRDGYVGPAPVPLGVYEKIVRAQSVARFPVTQPQVHAAFGDTVIRPELLDRLGPALSSGRAIFVYGDPGTGKTYIARRLARLLGPPVLLPHAVMVGESAIAYFDPSLHHPVATPDAADSPLLSAGFDARFVLCERPVVTSGGELTLDLLDLRYDPVARRYVAPLQMRANMGMLIIDDLGRQRVAPVDLFNRWIVPLEEGWDQLALHTGQHFAVPFDQVLVFSTNLDPKTLADEAFLRRIGHKIRFESSSRAEYVRIWRQVCDECGVSEAVSLVEFVLDELYPGGEAPLLPCHPRDLLRLALDYVRYRSRGAVDQEALHWAWRNYFLET